MLLQHLPEANSIVSDWPKDRLLRPKDRINLSSKKYKIESESNLHKHELQAGGPADFVSVAGEAFEGADDELC
jgi:hypothetical protein